MEYMEHEENASEASRKFLTVTLSIKVKEGLSWIHKFL